MIASALMSHKPRTYAYPCFPHRGLLSGHTGALLGPSVSHASWSPFSLTCWIELPLGNLETAAPVQAPQLPFKFPVSVGRNLSVS